MTQDRTPSASRDERFMRLALELAASAKGQTSPNPMVGCVIVQGDEIVGQGFHPRAGEAHAEVVALRQAGERARGAELYVNLEPCSHHGRTPPCAAAVVQAGVRRVVAGMIDPDSRVSGRGMRLLEEAGIETRVGVLEDEARALNRAFVLRATARRPQVTLKLAMSLDGKLATRSGDSQWITGEAARARVHQLRAQHDAIVVGTGTLLADQPRLTARTGHPGARSPHRFLIDAQLRSDAQAPTFDTELAAVTLLTAVSDRNAQQPFLERGVEVVTVDLDEQGHVDVGHVLREVHLRGYNTLMVEGGGELASAFVERGVVDELELFIAPIFLGGREAVPALGGRGVEWVSEAQRASSWSSERLGDDLHIHASFDAAAASEG